MVLLEHLINKKLKELYLGCEVDHPRQLRHSCLLEPDAYYFEELSRNLVKPGLKHIIAHTLSLCGLRIHPQRIQGSVDTILHEVCDEVYIVENLCEFKERKL